MRYFCFLFTSVLILSCGNVPSNTKFTFDIKGKWKVKELRYGTEYAYAITEDTIFIYYEDEEMYGFTPYRISNDTIYEEFLDLELLYDVIYNKSNMLKNTSYEEFEKFNDNKKQDLYNLSVEKGMFAEISFETYKTIWTQNQLNIETFDTLRSFGIITPFTKDSVLYNLYYQKKYDNFTPLEKASLKLGENVYESLTEIWTRVK